MIFTLGVLLLRLAGFSHFCVRHALLDLLPAGERSQANLLSGTLDFLSFQLLAIPNHIPHFEKVALY